MPRTYTPPAILTLTCTLQARPRQRGGRLRVRGGSAHSLQPPRSLHRKYTITRQRLEPLCSTEGVPVLNDLKHLVRDRAVCSAHLYENVLVPRILLKPHVTFGEVKGTYFILNRQNLNCIKLTYNKYLRKYFVINTKYAFAENMQIVLTYLFLLPPQFFIM